MIQIVITGQCPKCESPSMVKNGTDYKGDQKFHGQDGGRAVQFSRGHPQSRD